MGIDGKRRMHLWWWLPLLMLIAASAYGFALARNGPADFDASLLLWFRDSSDTGQLSGPQWIAAFWQGLTWLGNTTPRIVVACTILLGLLLLRRWHSALFLAGVLLSGIALSTILKQWIGRPRPQLVAHLDHASSLSFPSGHALNSTLFYLTVALIIAQFLRRRSQRWILYGAAISLLLGTGISRIALGVHYPTDVIAGWVIGAAWLGLWLAAARLHFPQALHDGPGNASRPVHS